MAVAPIKKILKCFYGTSIPKTAAISNFSDNIFGAFVRFPPPIIKKTRCHVDRRETSPDNPLNIIN
jgi:hypothetical protein